MTTEQAKPLPCPFCGKKARRSSAKRLRQGTEWGYRCGNVKCSMWVHNETTLARWNTRHEPEEVAEFIAGLATAFIMQDSGFDKEAMNLLREAFGETVIPRAEAALAAKETP